MLGKPWILIALFATAVLPIGASATNPDKAMAPTNFRGSPPFKRAPIAAGPEYTAVPQQVLRTVRRSTTIFRGRPPFKRTIDRAASPEHDDPTTTRFARFEELPAETSKRRRVGPPGKTHLRFRK